VAREIITPVGWEGADVDEFGDIVIFSKRSHEASLARSRPKTNASSRKGALKQGHDECEIQNPITEENLDALALPQQLRDSIVAWNARESSEILSTTENELTLGKVVAVDLKKGKALVSILPLTLNDLEKLTPGNNEQVKLKFCKQGSSHWVPFGKLLIVSQGPSMKDQKIVSAYTVANVKEREEMRIRAARAAAAQRRKREKKNKKNGSPKGKKARRRTLTG